MAVTRFGVSLDDSLLEAFDESIAQKSYATRSEAVRDLIRASLVSEEWESGKKETVGTVTIVYSHHTRELTDTLTGIQHRFHKSIVSSTHVHLDTENCLEVLVLRGKGRDIKKIAHTLIGTRGVKHGRLTATTTGKSLR